jgi:CRISPR-associated protein Csx10
LSDILLRNERGSYVANLDRLLGVKHQRAFVRTRVIGGFNHKWGLPLPQAQAIQSGSVYIYPQEDGLLTTLRQLEAKGVGERRAEGFGRLALNWQCNRKLQIKEVDAEKPLPVMLEGDSARLASQMVDRMLSAELDKKLVACVNRMPVDEDRLPSNAQLSRLRRVVRSALAKNNVKLITEHLDNLTKTAANQIKRSRIEGKPLNTWLQELVDNPQSVWVQLDITPQKQSNQISIGKVHPEFDDALALEYTFRLIDGVLLKAMKEREE